MAKKEVIYTSDENAIVKGIPGYTVVWKEDKVSSPEMVVKALPRVEAKATVHARGPGKSTTEQHEKATATHNKMHTEPYSLWYIHGLIMFLILVWLFFAIPEFFIIGIVIVLLLGFAFFYSRKHKKAYVDRIETQVVKLEILHPFKTGFEFAMGMGLFAAVCAAVGLILVVLLLGSILYGLYSIIQPYLPF